MAEEVKVVEKNEMGDVAVTTADVTPVAEPTSIAAEPVAATNPAVAKLIDLGVDATLATHIAEMYGAETEKDLGMLEEEEFTAAGLKLIQARKVAELVKPAESAPKTTAVPTSATASASAVPPVDSFLPTVPANEEWLRMLKTDGVLKFGIPTCMSAVRAALANRTKVLDVRQTIIDKIERHALDNDVAVDEKFFEIERQLMRNRHSELFAAVDSSNRRYATKKRKDELFRRIEEYLWPALFRSYESLISWCEAWNAGFNPNAIMLANIAAQSGVPGMATLPPGMMQIPDTGILQDAGDDVRNAINKCLAGLGAAVASALALDYMDLSSILMDDKMPELIGASNREQFLKRLGVDVDSSTIRNETNIVRYALSFVEADKVTADREAGYFSALYTLGTQINWRELGATRDLRRSSSLRTFGDDAGVL